MNIILKSKDIAKDEISIKKKINISNIFTNYPIKYNNKNLIIQTPIVYLPFGINKYNNKSYIDISLINSDVCNEMKQFKNLIKDINSLSKSKFKNCVFVSSYKKSEFYPDRLRLSFYEDMLIFDESKNLMTLDSIKSKIYVKLLISPQYVWKNNNSIGILWTILQIKIYSKPILDKYSFIDDEENIDKYTKMLKCRVPIQAIKNKMILDKKDPSLLDKYIKTNNLGSPENSGSSLSLSLMPPPPINLNLNLLKLKKTNNKKHNNKNSSNSNSNGFKVTLEDIKNVKLKKTKTVKSTHPFTHMNPFVNPEELMKIKNRILNN